MEGKATSADNLQERETMILKRLAAGLSDQEIADDLLLSVHTIKWYNRQIYAKLGVKSRTQVIAYANNLGLLHEAAVMPSMVTFSYRLPARPTPFIGRSREIVEVKQLLAKSRLLTLTGTGGTGKTRLALEVADAVASRFTDGVCFVDLAPLADPTLVVQAIAAALGVVENPTASLLHILQRVLADRQLLLVIDNVEHVIKAAPLISELLADAPYLRVLATSRESLHLAGEQEYPVPPLTVPTGDAISAQDIARSESGALFVQRARMALPHFDADDDNAMAIAEICVRLDGLPLAIELAAARCKLLTPQALLQRLAWSADHAPFHALGGGTRDAPPRHRTLSDTIAWSYNLLDEAEQRLFTRLAVFRGGRSLEAIEAVCADTLSIDPFDGLASLVDKSLVQQKEAQVGEPRFVLLETIQAYAHERLQASGEAAMLHRRHAEYFVALAERAEPELRLARYDHWCEVFELELDNIRAALEWSLGAQASTGASRVELGVRLAGAIGLFWYGKGHHVEGIRWTEQLLARLDEVPTIYHAKFLMSAGHMTMLGELRTAQHLFYQALDTARRHGDPLQMAWARTLLSYTMMHEPEAALPVAEVALRSFRALAHQPGIAQVLNIIGEIARVSSDDSAARQAYEECLDVCRQTGETRRVCYIWNNLAYLAQHAGDHERAMNLGRQGLQLARERQDRRDMAQAVITIAGSIGAVSDARAALLRKSARLLGVAEAAFERMGTFQIPSDKPEYDRIVAAVREHLDDATFRSEWAEGRSMTLERGITYALEEAERSIEGSTEDSPAYLPR